MKIQYAGAKMSLLCSALYAKCPYLCVVYMQMVNYTVVQTINYAVVHMQKINYVVACMQMMNIKCFTCYDELYSGLYENDEV